MKKLLPIIIAILVIAGAAGAYFATKKDSNSSPANPKTSDSPAASNEKKLDGKKACDVLALEDAKKMFGSSVEAGKSNNDAPTESSDLTVSTCTYSDGSAALGQSKTATILVRSAKTDAGVTSNKSQFGSQKPAGAQDVSGYGDAAFWNPAFGQLNVLKNNNWYIISSGSIKVADRTVDQAKQLADLIKNKL